MLSSADTQTFQETGFTVVPECLAEGTLHELRTHFGNNCHPQRNLLSLPLIRKVADSQPLKNLTRILTGRDCFAVRGIFFNKTPHANWKVVWHQDRTIAVRARKAVTGFGPWSIKFGVPHVQPPAEIMSDMVAVRLHLDESREENGPLRVIPGSHNEGYFSPDLIATWRRKPNVTCTVPQGGALVMRPLLLHASSSSASLEPRRVVHLEFAVHELPGGLEWFDHV